MMGKIAEAFQQGMKEALEKVDGFTDAVKEAFTEGFQKEAKPQAYSLDGTAWRYLRDTLGDVVPTEMSSGVGLIDPDKSKVLGHAGVVGGAYSNRMPVVGSAFTRPDASGSRKLFNAAVEEGKTVTKGMPDELSEEAKEIARMRFGDEILQEPGLTAYTDTYLSASSMPFIAQTGRRSARNASKIDRASELPMIVTPATNKVDIGATYASPEGTAPGLAMVRKPGVEDSSNRAIERLMTNRGVEASSAGSMAADDIPLEEVINVDNPQKFKESFKEFDEMYDLGGRRSWNDDSIRELTNNFFTAGGFQGAATTTTPASSASSAGTTADRVAESVLEGDAGGAAEELLDRISGSSGSGVTETVQDSVSAANQALGGLF